MSLLSFKKNGILIPFRVSTDSSQPHNLITCFYTIHLDINMRPASHPSPFSWGSSTKIMTVNNTFFCWDMTSYSLVEVLRRCVQKHCLQLIGRRVSERRKEAKSKQLSRFPLRPWSEGWITCYSQTWINFNFDGLKSLVGIAVRNWTLTKLDSVVHNSPPSTG